MEDLIKAFQIFMKVKPSSYVFCEHDLLFVQGPSPKELSEDDLRKLDLLGFMWDCSDFVWYTIRSA